MSDSNHNEVRTKQLLRQPWTSTYVSRRFTASSSILWMILQLNYALYFAMDTESFVRQGGDVFSYVGLSVSSIT